MLDAIAHRQHRNPANVLAALKTVTAAWDEGKVILQLAGPLQASKDETSTGSEMACKEMASPVSAAERKPEESVCRGGQGTHRLSA